MPVMKRILGLDLGSHSLKAVEFCQTFRGLEPVQFRVQPRNESGAPLSDQLRQFFAAYQLPNEQVITAVSSDCLTQHQLEFPFRDRKRLNQTVPYEVEGRIPFDLDDIVVDWQMVGGGARDSVVVAVLAQRRDISSLLDELGTANCDPRVLEAEGMALGNLASVYDVAGRRMLVDLGHSKTTLTLMIDDLPVRSRSFRLGGKQITEAIAADLGWNLIDAERWKCEDGVFGADLTSRSPGALEVLDGIAREIVRSLDAAETLLGGTAEAQLDCITLLGGGARLHRVDEYLTGRTSIVATNLALPQVADDASLVAGGDSVLFAPAVALALRGTARAKTKMNFRKDEFAYRTNLTEFLGKDMRGTAVLGGLTAAFFIGSVASSVALESGQAGQANDEIAQIYNAAFPGQPLPANPVKSMIAAVHDARQRADFLGVYGGNRSALDLMTELSKRIPKNLDVVFEEVTIDPKVIRIKVSAKSFDSPDRLIEALQKEKDFAHAKVTGEVKKVKEKINFSVSVPLAAGADDT